MEDFKKDVYGSWGDLNPVTFPYPDDNYINEKSKIYKYYIRKFLPQNKDANILDLGCGYGIFLKSCRDLGYKNVFGVEFIEKCINFAKDKFKINTISNILAEHVWEHLSYEDGLIAARNCYKYLKPGGMIRVAVPDGNFRNDWYQNMVKIGGPGPIVHPAYTHKVVYK